MEIKINSRVRVLVGSHDGEEGRVNALTPGEDLPVGVVLDGESPTTIYWYEFDELELVDE